jgi:2-polyprenyl-6-methoxyphenol hydroxylase-like FAD-dependent oxidoreductase
VCNHANTLGQGTGAAIVGSYVLAGEISKSSHDIPAALAEYERIARQYVDKAQKLIPGAPQIANPQTEWGITVFNRIVGTLAHPYARKFGQVLGSWMPAFGSTTVWTPPEYGSAEA